MTIEILVLVIISKSGQILFAEAIKDIYEMVQIYPMVDMDYVEESCFEEEFQGEQEVQHLSSENFIIKTEYHELEI